MSATFQRWISCLGNAWPRRALLYVPFALALCLPGTGAASPRTATWGDDSGLEWQDEHGASTRLSDWRDRTVLLTMAYSTCREVCSYALHRLEELQQSADHAGTPIEVIVISYDPAVDSPGTWTIYRQHHHFLRTNWHFLTGSSAATRQLAQDINFPSWRYDEHVVHDFRILRIAPGGQIAGSLDWATRNQDFFRTTSITCPSSDPGECKP